MIAHKRVLVVDDEAMVLFIFNDTLQGLGDTYEIVTAQNGRDALDECAKRSFDLVITDLSMPGMDGIELTEAIKATNPKTAVVWITAYGCHNVASEARRLGVASCRDKPLEVQEILEMTRQALNTNHQPAH